MTVRNTPGNSYSASADLELIESHLAKVLFILGLDWADINTITIDDILNKINENYWLDPNGGAVSGQSYAPHDYNKINNGLLATLARRNWYWRQLAVGVS
jgi:hypothetical protein